MVLVRWLDSALRYGQHAAKDLADFGPVKMETIGWLVRMDDATLVLAMELVHDGDNTEYRGLVAIPRFAVTHEEPVRTGKHEEGQ